MKRDIQFRAFTTLGMLKGVSLYNDNDMFGLHIEAFEEQVPEALNGECWSDNEDELEKHKLTLGEEWVFGEGPIMQFIGLFDKKGKQIYEGDLFSIHGTIHQVYFKTGSFCSGKTFESSEPIGWVSDHENGEMREYLEWISDRIEIIGNIHENPELLNEPNY